MAAAIGLAPASGVLAAENDMDTNANSSSMNLSIDFLSLTDFSLNPTDDTWVTVVQQLRAHPCFRTVGEEADWCKDTYGFTADIETLLRRTDFVAWLRNEMIDAVCGAQTGINRATCLANIPMITGTDMTLFQQQLSGEASADIDMTTSNEALFQRAGTPLTTRQKALDIIEQNESESAVLTTHERARLLWNACENSSMGQNGCYHSFHRYIDDRTLDINDVRGVIDRNGRGSDRDNDDE